MFHILVAEDDPNARKLLKTVLARAEYTVSTAENGKAALELLDTQHVDLIILDVMMPGMDGYALTRELREAGSMIPILMVTAKQLPSQRFSCRSVRKPSSSSTVPTAGRM